MVMDFSCGSYPFSSMRTVCCAPNSNPGMVPLVTRPVCWPSTKMRAPTGTDMISRCPTRLIGSSVPGKIVVIAYTVSANNAIAVTPWGVFNDANRPRQFSRWVRLGSMVVRVVTRATLRPGVGVVTAAGPFVLSDAEVLGICASKIFALAFLRRISSRVGFGSEGADSKALGVERPGVGDSIFVSLRFGRAALFSSVVCWWE